MLNTANTLAVLMLALKAARVELFLRGALHIVVYVTIVVAQIIAAAELTKTFDAVRAYFTLLVSHYF